MKNKGFSLVELIIVIAIMAILAAAIAPALIRYIDKSRRADDVAAGETINTAVSAALANEDAYSEVAGQMNNNIIGTAQPGSTFSTGHTNFDREVNSSIGEGAPKLKYTKTTDTIVPGSWSIGISENGKPVVWIGGAAGNYSKWEIQPDICASYK